MKLPLRSIRPASQPSGKFHCSNSGGRCAGSMHDAEAQRRLALAQHRHLDGDDGRLQHGAAENVGYLHLAGLDGAASAARRRWPDRQRHRRRALQIDELLAVLVAQHDPAAATGPGAARSASWRKAARSSALQGRRGRQHLRHRDLLAEDRIDRVHQRAGREQDGFAAGLALVVGELPDDARGQQHERQRHREREQHQAVADTPAFVWNCPGLAPEIDVPPPDGAAIVPGGGAQDRSAA